MELWELARRLPDDGRAELEPVPPETAGPRDGRPRTATGRARAPGRTCRRPGSPGGYPGGASVARGGPAADASRAARRRSAERAHRIHWDPVPDGSEEPSQGGEAAGPPPVDRGKAGTARHLAGDGRAPRGRGDRGGPPATRRRGVPGPAGPPGAEGRCRAGAAGGRPGPHLLRPIRPRPGAAGCDLAAVPGVVREGRVPDPHPFRLVR